MDLTAHEANFTSLMIKENIGELDVERTALFYILAIPEIYEHIQRIYNFEEQSIKSDGLKEGYFSDRLRVMIELAFNLYNGYESQTPFAIFSKLDSTNFDICMNAIKIRFKQPFENHS